MRFYLASRFSRAEELARHARQLTNLGYCVTSRWITDPTHRLASDDLPGNANEFNARLALEDLEDLNAADALILFGPGSTRGGCHVEFGYALARGKRVCWVGERSHTFAWLPCVAWVPDFDALLSALPAF